MLKAVGRQGRVIILNRPTDVINLCASLRMHIACGHHLNRNDYIIDALDCLEASLESNKDLHDIGEVKSAFFCLATLLDRTGNDYRLADLALRALYTWEWKSNSPSHYLYFIDLLFQRIVNIFPFIKCLDQDITPLLIVDLLKYCGESLSIFIDAALDRLYECRCPLWPVTVTMLKHCNDDLLDHFVTFGKRVWLIWGASQELILAIFDKFLASHFQATPSNLCDWLSSIFEGGGPTAESINSYILSRIFKSVQRTLGDKNLGNLLEILNCIPHSPSLANLAQKLADKTDLGSLSSETSVKFMNLLVNCQNNKEAERLLTASSHKGLNQQVLEAYLRLTPTTTFLSVLDNTTTSVKKETLNILNKEFTARNFIENMDGLAVDVVFERVISLVKDLIKSSNEQEMSLIIDTLTKLCKEAISSGKKSPQWLFDLLSFNNSWIKMHHIARTIPFAVFSHLREHRSGHELEVNVKFLLTSVVCLADYSTCEEISPDLRFLQFESELYHLFTEYHMEALFAIAMIEQVLLRAIQETTTKPGWYDNYYMLVMAHLFQRYRAVLTQRAVLLRTLNQFRQAEHLTLALLVHAVDPTDAVELMRHFLPSERHVSGYIENLVFSFDAAFVYSMFELMLRRPSFGRIIDMFMDWLFLIGTVDLMDLVAPIFALCVNEEYLLECGKACFRLFMHPSHQLTDYFMSAVLKVFDGCCRRLHPSIIFKAPPMPISTLPATTIAPGPNSRHHFPLCPDMDIDVPNTVEDLFFMLGSLLRTKREVPVAVSEAVSLYFEKLKAVK